jgi:two-component system sensor histidine kinase YesM
LNPFKRYRIGALFFCCFSGFIIVILIVVIWVSYYFSVEEVKQITTAHQQAVLNYLNKDISNKMRSIEELSLAISTNNDFRGLLSVQGDAYARSSTQLDITVFLSQFIYSVPMIHSVDLFINNPFPDNFQKAVRYYDYEKLHNEKWYPLLERSDFIWIGDRTIYAFDGDKAVISFARKVFTPSGKSLGVLVVNVKSSDVQKMLYGDEQEANRMLLDSGARLITYVGNNSQIDGGIDTYVKVVNEENEQVSILLKRQGVTRYQDLLIVWSTLYSSDWLLVEISKWSEVTAGSRKIATVLYSISFAAIVAVLFFTLYLSKKFTLPITLLLNAMNRFHLAQTNDTALPNDYHNEFGVLFRGFEKMAERISQLYTRLIEQHKRQQLAEIKALQAMINPHFLYNTLDTINWMAIERDQQDISKVLELTGKMLRIGLSKGDSLIKLSDELLHIQYYLEIQQLQTGEVLDYRIFAPESLLSCYVPKFTLQPIVENCIMHAFQETRNGLIAIRVSEEQGRMAICVQDNGQGMSGPLAAGSDMDSRPEEARGYGLRNVKERLEAYFEDQYVFRIESEPGAGTTVYIHIPVMEDKTKFGGL